MIMSFFGFGRVLFLPILILFQLSSEGGAGEQLKPQRKETPVNALGTVLLDKRTNEFYFVFLDDKHEVAYPISVTNRKTFEQLKNLKNKWVRVSGHSKWIKETFIEMPRYSLKLEIAQLEEFRLSELKIIHRKNQSKIAEIDYRVIDRDKEGLNSNGGGVGIAISDEATNDMIAGAGVIMGIAIGPMSLIPAGLFGLKSIFLDD